MSLATLQIRLAYDFHDANLLARALTHRSYGACHNERLEFLGDAVLNCVVAAMLFERYSQIDEGDLSRLRANFVKQASLAEIAQKLELAHELRLGEGELKSGGYERPSILADTLEAIFGAIFLDGGFEAARQVIHKQYQPILVTLDPKALGKDAKTLLQEFVQQCKLALPIYTVIATHGAAHRQQFEVECAIPPLQIKVVAAGSSRRVAEQSAAKLALEAALTAKSNKKGTHRVKQARKTAQRALSLTVQEDK